MHIDRKVSDYMTQNVATVSVNTNVADVADKFLKNSYRRFPVVDDNGKLMGQVSRRDILRAVKDMKITTW
jgi:CBS domain-containing protein